MNSHRQTQLQAELRSAGADDAELRSLLPIAAELALLQDAPARPPSRRNWLRFAKPAAFALPGVVAGMFLVIASQAVLPTSRLYPVQRLSDSVAVAMHPSYRADVMMKRARQVHELVARHADSGTVLATLAAYTAEAGAYKAQPHASYAAFEYCETNLMQAAAIAAPGEKQAIAQSLQVLEAT